MVVVVVGVWVGFAGVVWPVGAVKVNKMNAAILQVSVYKTWSGSWAGSVSGSWLWSRSRSGSVSWAVSRSGSVSGSRLWSRLTK